MSSVGAKEPIMTVMSLATTIIYKSKTKKKISKFTMKILLSTKPWRSYATVCASWKVPPKFLKFVVCNPCQSSLSFTILVPLWFINISLVFFYLSKLLFSGFLQFKGNFVGGQNNSKIEVPELTSRPSGHSGVLHSNLQAIIPIYKSHTTTVMHLRGMVAKNRRINERTVLLNVNSTYRVLSMQSVHWHQLVVLVQNILCHFQLQKVITCRCLLMSERHPRSTH